MENLPIPPEILVAVGVFVGVLLIFDGVRRIIGRASSTEAKAERRVKAAAGPAATALPSLLSATPRIGRMERFVLALDGAGIKMKPAALLALIAGAGLLGFSVAAMFLSLPMAVGLTVVLTLLIPYAVIDRMREMRITKLTEQLPDALDLMGRALQVGHPINTSMQAVAKEMPAPISIEFGRMVDEVTYGEEVSTAFQDLARRNKSEDLNYLAVAVGIQHGTGGDLAKILHILSKTIRDRATMRRKIHAISSEGRISAIILSILPFGIVGMTSFMSPSYYGDVAGHPHFLTLSLVVVALVLLNIMIMRKLVTFRI